MKTGVVSMLVFDLAVAVVAGAASAYSSSLGLHTLTVIYGVLCATGAILFLGLAALVVMDR